jgi:hypothetical protein
MCALAPRAALLLALAWAIAGCAPTSMGQRGDLPSGDAARPLPANAEPPAPGVNLSGFPLLYRQGYADGCASAKGPARKDAARFASDGNYRTGWQDGLALCKAK